MKRENKYIIIYLYVCVHKNFYIFIYLNKIYFTNTFIESGHFNYSVNENI